MSIFQNIQTLRYFDDMQNALRIFTLCFFLSSLLIPAESLATSHSTKTMYLWNTEGSTLYASPFDDADTVGRLHYGESVEIVEILEGEPVQVTIYKQQNGPQHSAEYLKDYQLSSNWVKVQYDNQSGYILDTYLSSIPPPDDSHDMGFIIENYLKSLSLIISEKKEEKTKEFCARNTLHFDNEVRYTYTDFGPCEQCGHAQNEIYFPTVSKNKGIIMALHFFRLGGLFSEGNEVVLKETTNSLEIEGYYEYGQTQVMQIIEQEHGVLLIEDFYM